MPLTAWSWVRQQQRMHILRSRASRRRTSRRRLRHLLLYSSERNRFRRFSTYSVRFGRRRRFPDEAFIRTNEAFLFRR